jgi:hypothetical protein
VSWEKEKDGRWGFKESKASLGCLPIEKYLRKNLKNGGCFKEIKGSLSRHPIFPNAPK